MLTTFSLLSWTDWSPWIWHCVLGLSLSLKTWGSLKVEMGGPKTPVIAAEFCLPNNILPFPRWKEINCVNITEQFCNHRRIHNSNVLQYVMQRCLTWYLWETCDPRKECVLWPWVMVSFFGISCPSEWPWILHFIPFLALSKESFLWGFPEYMALLQAVPLISTKF